VVQECLQKDPHDRPESARDVADELRRVASDGHSPSASVWIRRWSVVVLAFVAIAAMLVRVAGRLKSAPAAETAPAPMRILPLTTLPGYEFAPALSPDGSMVAFAWDEGKPGQLSLYVQTIGSAEARRVDGPLDWIGVMAWSPDARRIAFLTRHPDGTRRIRVTSLVDNTSQLLSDVPVVRGGLDWSPDGLTIAALQAPAVGEKAPDGSARPLDDTDNAGIVLIPVDGNTPHHLTRRTPPVRDADPHFSPDGRSVAFASCANACTVSVVALDGLEPRGTPRPLTPLVARVSRVAWSRDGRTILFDSRSAIGLFSLWRVPVNGSRPLERVEEAGYIGHAPSTARHSDRLVFDRVLDDWDIYRIESGHDAQPWAASSLVDIEPQYAPDGRRVVFSSTRTGTAEEIWIAAADGTAARQLTHGPNSHQRSAIWSPDSTRVAFDSQSGDGRWHVWVIDAEGGPARQITTGPEGEDVAGWSPDGTEIYFMTQRAGGTILWRTPATGMGQRQIVDREAGYIAGISIDGNVVFQTKLDQSPLMIKPITGGPGRELAACALAYAEQPQGFYYVGCPTQPGADPDVHFIPRPSGEDRIVCHLKNWALESWFTVSPDGKSMLYEQQVRRGSDVMLIENFR
jgi:Tol biopolymer transport system component